jgi:hypothetical protein
MTVTPALGEAEIKKITGQGQPRKKVSETPISTKILVVVACTCHPS